MQALIILLTLATQDCSYYLCFIFFYIFSSSDLVSKDKTFNTRQEKEPLVVDPLGLFKVLPHSPAKKVVCSTIIVIITWLFFFCILNTSGIICAPRIPVPRRKQPNSSDRNPRPSRNGVHHLTQPESSFAMSILFHQPNMSNEHSYMCAKAHRKPQLQTQTKGGTVCGTDWHLGRFRRLRRWILCHWDRHLWCQVFLYPFLSSCFDVSSLMIFHIIYRMVFFTGPPKKRLRMKKVKVP